MPADPPAQNPPPDPPKPSQPSFAAGLVLAAITVYSMTLGFYSESYDVRITYGFGLATCLALGVDVSKLLRMFRGRGD